MKYLLVPAMMLMCLSLQAQHKNNNMPVNSWTQGKKDASGNIVKADASRAGWYMLKLNADSTLVFNDPFSCGFGFEKHGRWQQQNDSIIRFLYNSKVGYMNNKGTIAINETEIYKIVLMEKEALILEQQAVETPRTLIFIANK